MSDKEQFINFPRFTLDRETGVLTIMVKTTPPEVSKSGGMILHAKGGMQRTGLTDAFGNPLSCSVTFGMIIPKKLREVAEKSATPKVSREDSALAALASLGTVEEGEGE